MYEAIVYQVGDRIARITLNRPDARNALNDLMIEELLDAFDRARADDRIRVIVLTGTGDRAFCAGADLGGADRARRAGRSIAGVDAQGPDDATGDSAGDRAGGRASSIDAIHDSPAYRLFTAFPTLGKPIIARLAGHAIAGGLGLAASCDLVIAADDVKLGTPEVNVGLWPMMIMAIINRNVAPKQAFKLYYTGQTINAREGVDVGLVTEAVPRDGLDARVDELARAIAAKSPVGLRHGRDAFFAIEGLPFDDQIAHLLGRLVVVAETEDAKEGITAFLEKRSPEFTGR
ncbi:enoyl-CoA hydratase/isomerase family protein [Actinomadura sp. HBU206391]|uniref:enoyl-CoA hydratase/isomerase family protein n=1 Tax=Actinomadura sp. HBU206391 TaxID=2731692 RepID=UPI0021C9FB67|nr:enoyl-CoA hydratase-related protein [Actinomadura sp. HBU206391]